VVKTGQSFGDSEMADRVVPWFDAAIGVCLILGLLTRPAAILGAIFLASICLSQWPLTPGAAPIYNQAIEMLALLVLAAVGAGRFLGLDYFLSCAYGACFGARRTPNAAIVTTSPTSTTKSSAAGTPAAQRIGAAK
jgi:hypothetical protein